MRDKIEKTLLQISFWIDELVNRKKYFYLRPELSTTRILIGLKMSNKTRYSSERLEKYIVGIHDRDKRIRTFNHFKQLRTNGKRNKSVKLHSNY
jgi:hypothetical protein